MYGSLRVIAEMRFRPSVNEQRGPLHVSAMCGNGCLAYRFSSVWKHFSALFCAGENAAPERLPRLVNAVRFLLLPLQLLLLGMSPFTLYETHQCEIPNQRPNWFNAKSSLPSLPRSCWGILGGEGETSMKAICMSSWTFVFSDALKCSSSSCNFPTLNTRLIPTEHKKVKIGTPVLVRVVRLSSLVCHLVPIIIICVSLRQPIAIWLDDTFKKTSSVYHVNRLLSDFGVNNLDISLDQW